MGPATNLFLGYAAELLRIPFTYPLEVRFYTAHHTSLKWKEPSATADTLQSGG